MEFKYSDQPEFIKKMVSLFESDTISDIINEDYLGQFYKEFGCDSKEELNTKIDSTIEFNNNTLNRVVLYPMEDYFEVEQLYLKYMALSPNEKSNSDAKARKIFGMDNRQIYNFVKDHVVKSDGEEDIEKYNADSENVEFKNDSVFTNDLPLLTPQELIEKIDEDYSCFNEPEANIIKAWREEYALLTNGIKSESYDLHNIQRLNILRNAIYENNISAILQCGWIPGVEFNSENRIKATEIVKRKVQEASNAANSINMESITEAKSFPVQFDNEGNLLLKNIKKINFEQEYANSHRLLMQYDKSNSYEPMKFELAKMQFFITLLEKRIFKQGKDRSVDELKVRARFINDFKKYLKIIMNTEPSFNFTEYYEKTPFNDAIIKIDKNTLKYGFKTLKYVIK